MPESGTPTKLIEQVENDTAAMSDALAELRQIELLHRAQARRGILEPWELVNLENATRKIRSALERNLDYTRFARGNPKDAMGK